MMEVPPEIEGLATKLMGIMSDVTEVRDAVMEWHEQRYDDIYTRYNITENEPFNEVKVSSVIDDMKITAEYDRVLEEWVAVKARGGPELSEDQKIRYVAFIEEMLLAGDALIADITFELTVLGLEVQGPCLKPPSTSYLQICSKYIDGEISGIVCVPMDKSAAVSFTARIL